MPLQVAPSLDARARVLGGFDGTEVTEAASVSEYAPGTGSQIWAGTNFSLLPRVIKR